MEIDLLSPNNQRVIIAILKDLKILKENEDRGALGYIISNLIKNYEQLEFTIKE